MHMIWLVMQHEIRVTLSKRGYWVMTFLLPLFIIGGTLLPQMIAGDKLEEDPLVAARASLEHIGYVDLAGVIKKTPPGLPPTLLTPYPDTPAAQQALAAGNIDQYYLISADFLETGEVVIVSKDFNLFAGMGGEGLINYVIDYNLSGDPLLAAIFVNPTAQVDGQALAPTTATQLDSNSSFSLVPFFMMFVLFFVITITAGFMLQSVSKEKENRTVEVLLLSLRPRQLMAGKVLGLGVVALLQMVVWMFGARTALLHGTSAFSLPTNFSLSPNYLALLLAFFLLGYFLYASLLGALGALAPNVREGTQFTFLIILPLLIPIWTNSTFATDPNGLFPLILSLFPLTAPTAMVARLAVTSVPAWQLAFSLVSLLLTSYGFVVLAAHFFRADTLLSSGSIQWRRVWQELRTGSGSES